MDYKKMTLKQKAHRIEYLNKYYKENTKSYHIKFTNKTQQDVIDYLDSKQKKSQYIAQLIRLDMKLNLLPKND